MRRRPLRILVCVSLLLLVLVAPPSPSHPRPPLLIASSRISSTVELQAAIQAEQERHDEELARWYQWAASQPTPKREGMQGAQAKQEQASYAAGSIESLICSVFGDSCDHAIRVARCESGLNPSAYNRSGASGLFQLLRHGDMFEAHGWSPDDVFDPYKNSVVAFDLSRGGTNWSPWVCR